MPKPVLRWWAMHAAALIMLDTSAMRPDGGPSLNAHAHDTRKWQSPRYHKVPKPVLRWWAMHAAALIMLDTSAMRPDGGPLPECPCS